MSGISGNDSFHKIEILFLTCYINKYFPAIINNNNFNTMDSENKMNILPVKYSKFATFAYWFLEELKTSHIIQEDSYSAICDFVHLTDGDIPTQAAFYERFLTEYDCVSKVFKSLNKKPKPGKNKKPAQEKKMKTKKNMNSNNANLDIISQIVLRANSVEEDFDLSTPAASTSILQIKPPAEFSQKQEVNETEDNNQDEVVEKKSKEKREKKVKEVKEKKVKEVKEKKVKEVKEKKVKEVKEKKVKEEPIAAADDVAITSTVIQPEPEQLNDIATSTEPIENQNFVDESNTSPTVAVKNTPILVEKTKIKKEKKDKEVKQKKEEVKEVKVKEVKVKEVKEKKEPKEKKEKEPKEKKVKEVKEKKEKKEKKSGENEKETNNVVLDTELNKQCYVEKADETKIDMSSISNALNEIEMEEDDDEEDIDLYAVMIDDVEYYYDDAKNLYNSEQTIIGTFDPTTQDITYFEK